MTELRTFIMSWKFYKICPNLSSSVTKFGLSKLTQDSQDKCMGLLRARARLAHQKLRERERFVIIMRWDVNLIKNAIETTNQDFFLSLLHICYRSLIFPFFFLSIKYSVVSFTWLCEDRFLCFVFFYLRTEVTNSRCDRNIKNSFFRDFWIFFSLLIEEKSYFSVNNFATLFH